MQKTFRAMESAYKSVLADLEQPEEIDEKVPIQERQVEEKSEGQPQVQKKCNSRVY